MNGSELNFLDGVKDYADKFQDLGLKNVLSIIRHDHKISPKNFGILQDICQITFQQELKSLSESFNDIDLKKKKSERFELYRQCFLAAEQLMFSFDHFAVRFSYYAQWDQQEKGGFMEREELTRLTEEYLRTHPNVADKVVDYMVHNPMFADRFLEISTQQIMIRLNFNTPTAINYHNDLLNSTKSLENLIYDAKSFTDNAALIAAHNDLVELRKKIVASSDGLKGVRSELLKEAAITPGFMMSENLLFLPQNRLDRLKEVSRIGKKYKHLIEANDLLVTQMMEEIADLERIGSLTAIRIGQEVEESKISNDILDQMFRYERSEFWEGEMQEAYQNLLSAWGAFKVARSRVIF